MPSTSRNSLSGHAVGSLYHLRTHLAAVPILRTCRRRLGEALGAYSTRPRARDGSTRGRPRRPLSTKGSRGGQGPLCRTNTHPQAGARAVRPEPWLRGRGRARHDGPCGSDRRDPAPTSRGSWSPTRRSCARFSEAKAKTDRLDARRLAEHLRESKELQQAGRVRAVRLWSGEPIARAGG
jgi:hypothetical protein